MNQDTSSDPNENYDKFIEIVLSAKAKHIPTKKKKFNGRKHIIQKKKTKELLNQLIQTIKCTRSWYNLNVTMNYMKYLKHDLTHR